VLFFKHLRSTGTLLKNRIVHIDAFNMHWSFDSLWLQGRFTYNPNNELAEVYESLLDVFNSPLLPNVVLDPFHRTGHTAPPSPMIKFVSSISSSPIPISDIPLKAVVDSMYSPFRMLERKMTVSFYRERYWYQKRYYEYSRMGWEAAGRAELDGWAIVRWMDQVVSSFSYISSGVVNLLIYKNKSYFSRRWSWNYRF
jgi:hypothetical protein